MAELFLTARPALVDYRMTIDDPVPPFAANMLAASGLFDSIEIRGTKSGAGDVRLEGRALLKAALVVLNPLNKELEAQKAERVTEGKTVFCLEHRQVMTAGVCTKCGQQ